MATLQHEVEGGSGAIVGNSMSPPSDRPHYPNWPKPGDPQTIIGPDGIYTVPYRVEVTIRDIAEAFGPLPNHQAK